MPPIYPDISDVLAQKARARRNRAVLEVTEKLEILDRLREAAKAVAIAQRAESQKPE